MIALVFDTETTGLSPNVTIAPDKRPEIIEYCGILVDLASAEIKHLYWTLIQPLRPLPAEITGITGITREMLEGQPFWANVGKQIIQQIESAPLVIAHNLSFDKEVIDIQMLTHNREVRWPPGICTVEQTIHMKGHRLNLSSLYQMLFGEQFEDAHRAEQDTKALVRVCCELYKRGLL